jgi:hypothetical protein
MRQSKTFGRRARIEPQRPAAAMTRLNLFQDAPRASISALPQPSNDEIADVDRELEEWKAARKLYRRSFREPWRTLAIATSIGFGLSFWLLPDSVADVVQYVTAGLTLASVFAGMRRPKSRAEGSLEDRIEPTA